MNYDYLFKFLTLGDSGVGKTSLLCRYADGCLSTKFNSTVGIDYKEKRLIYQSHRQNKRVLLQLWDTAGQERYRSITTSFYRDAVGYILVYDLTNEKSFLGIRSWIDQLKSHACKNRPDVILCGNKVDLEEHRVVTKRRAMDIANEHGVIHFETSAVTGQNIELAVETLLHCVMKRLDNSIAHTASSEKINLTDQTSASYCSC